MPRRIPCGGRRGSSSWSTMQGPCGGRRHSNSPIIEIHRHPPCAPPREIRAVEVDENDRYVSSFLNQRTVKSLYMFPPEILQSDEMLFALFKVWKNENQLYFPPGREDERRFEGFKETVLDVLNANCDPTLGCLCLNKFAAHLPSDPYEGCHVTEEEGERLKPFIPRQLCPSSDEDDEDKEY